MKEQMKYSKKQLYQTVMIFMLMTVASAVAATRYVDPVNGNDEWNGLWLKHFPDTILGPVATIETAINLADWRDTIILLDGLYTGPENTGQAIFASFVDKGVHLCSLNGPDNCILQLSELLDLESDPSVIRCTFDGITFDSALQSTDNNVMRLGNIYLLFQNCVFQNFDAYSLMGNRHGSHLELEDCTFINNTSYHIIRCIDDAQLMLSRCKFQNNEIYTGAVSIYEQSVASIEQCTFDNNIADGIDQRQRPMAMIEVRSSEHTKISQCRFTNNVSTGHFSLISITESQASADIDSCIIENNTADKTSESWLAGIECSQYAEVNISNTRIENLCHLNNNLQAFGVWTDYPKSLTIKNCSINYNNTGFRCFHGQFNPDTIITISDTEFLGNTYLYSDEPYDGCGISVIEAMDSNIHIERCTFSDNKIGIFSSQQAQSQSIISNCLFVNNEVFALHIHGFYDLQLPIKNCTFVDNPGNIFAVFIYFKNCIFRNTFFDDMQPSLDNVTVDYSFVEGGWDGPGTGNIIDFPQFGNYYEGDYHLKSHFGRYDPALDMWVQDEIHSPCIDSGDPGDFAGDEPYGSGGRINMGCYGGTWQASKSAVCTGGMDGKGKMLSDFNHDCLVNLADFSWFASEWLQSTISY